jgi:preprotein translocase subunit SecG
MTIFLTTLHVMVCLILIVVVLLQRGKGAEIGAVFGGGASTTIFGSRGAGNFLTRLTTGAAIVFMATSLLLAYFARERATTSVFDEGAPPAAEEPAPGEGAPEGAGGFQEVQPAPAQPEAAAPEAPAPEAARPEAAAPAAPPAEGAPAPAPPP